MTSNKRKKIDNWLSIFFGALAILAIKSIFDSDDSKIVSKKGRKILQDKEKMAEINELIKKAEKSSSKINEICI